MNQDCDTVYRIGGFAEVAAVAGGTALWSAIAVPSATIRGALVKVIGATPNG